LENHLTFPATAARAKPFLKWAGGKTQLFPKINHLISQATRNWPNFTYVEPFVGGGAVLFQVLRTYSQVSSAIINDLNPDLIDVYRAVRDQVAELIEQLAILEEHYFGLPLPAQRRAYFLQIRENYNQNRHQISNAEKAAYFIFLNKTCFNGLYRVNSKGKFNVPFGRHAQPTLCDRATLLADSALLQKVTLLSGDYAQTLAYVTGGVHTRGVHTRNTLFYLDPPYRPISSTANFNTYAKEAFDDREQMRLRNYCDQFHAYGHRFILSNSDPKNLHPQDSFFDDLYRDYSIRRIPARRFINSNAQKRGPVNELLIANF
jgi:DNA adenine methylase